MSAILRHRHPNRFTILPNDAIRNPALSFRAVGVLAHLLSLPDGARVDSASLAEAHKEGRDAVRSAFGELAAHGYYRREIVRLPDGTLRTEVVVSSTPMDNAQDEGAGQTEDGFSGVGQPAPGKPAPGYPASVFQAPKEKNFGEVTLKPPQPPRTAGGLTNASLNNNTLAGPGGRRADGTNLRFVGMNPRAEGEAIAADRERERVAALAAEAERRATERRAVEAAAGAETQAAEAERLALAASLDDDTLTAVVERVTRGLAGPLARSPLAVSRQVVLWCRTAVARRPGPLPAAVTAALAEERDGTGDDGTPAAPLLDLPAPGPDTPRLQDRIRTLRDAPVTQLAAIAAP